jgi:hypothetical protein
MHRCMYSPPPEDPIYDPALLPMQYVITSAPSTPFQSTIWAWIIGIVAGSGVIWPVLKRFQSRPRFGLSARLDNSGKIALHVVQTRAVKAQVTDIEILAVRTIPYRVIRKIFRRSAAPPSNIILVSAAGSLKLDQNESPVNLFVTLPPPTVLPQAWRPLRPDTVRKVKRSELRLAVTASRARLLVFGDNRYTHRARIRKARGAIETPEMRTAS